MPHSAAFPTPDDIFSLLDALLKTSHGIWQWEPPTGAFHFNDTFLTMLGYPADGYARDIATWHTLIHPDDLQPVMAKQDALAASPAAGERQIIRLRLKTATGDYMPVLLCIFVVSRDAHGKATRITGMHIDRNAADALVSDFAMQHERMRLALEAARDGILDWIPATGEAYFSPRYLAMCGYIPSDFPPHIDSWTKRIHPDDLDIAINRQRELIDSPAHGDLYECIYRFRTIHGDYKWMLGRSKIIARDRNGKALRIIGLHTDITELRNRQESLTHLINHDTLTGLYSRFYFDDQLARLHEEHYPLSIIYGDMDGLKLVNDHLGHATGDILLQTAATLIRHGTRANDIVARTGGDEFIILLLRCTEDAARKVLQRIRTVMNMHNNSPDTMPVFISFGLASARQKTPISALIAQADRQMIEEKAKNRPSNLGTIKHWIESKTGTTIDLSDTRLRLQ